MADFIGETNFLTGQVQGLEGSNVVLQVDELGVPLYGLPMSAMQPGDRVAVSIRPEKIRLSDHAALNTNCLPAEVIDTAYIGSDTRVIIDIGFGKRMRVWEQNKISTLDPRAYYTQGQRVWAILLPENTLVLPEEKA